MEIMLRSGNSFCMDMQCFACGSVFEMDDVVADVKESSGHVVCPECLKAGPEGIRERLRLHAAELRKKANALEAVAAGEIAAPPFSEYEQVGQKVTGQDDVPTPVHLAIKYNNAATNDPCALCGERTDPVVGPELFLADNWAVVCQECGEKYEPELVALLGRTCFPDSLSASLEQEEIF